MHTQACAHKKQLVLQKARFILVFVDKVTTINCQGWICVDFYVVEGHICDNVYVIEGWKCKPILLTSKKMFMVLLQTTQPRRDY